MVTEKQRSHMRWAIALALEGAGCTAPNPLVGAVIVKGDRVVGEGYHRKAGTPHAEIHALRQAGRRAHGADMYVTLEPCCHEGRTPPCIDAIVEAGVSRVFIGTRDLNPQVNGRGVRALKRSGIRVVEGVLEESCRRINEAYNKFIISGLPFVTAKVGLSLDGKLATASGDSRWITNGQARNHVHKLRRRVDAVMVGGGTVRRDDPRLTVRSGGLSGMQPKAVVVDEVLGIPRSSRLVKRCKGELIAVTTDAAPIRKRRWLERLGHRVVICRRQRNGRVNLSHMLRELASLGLTSILLEGGGELFADFFRQGLVDRVVTYVAPKLVGGAGMDFLPGISIKGMRDAKRLKDVRVQFLGDNVLIEGNLR